VFFPGFSGKDQLQLKAEGPRSAWECICDIVGKFCEGEWILQ